MATAALQQVLQRVVQQVLCIGTNRAATQTPPDLPYTDSLCAALLLCPRYPLLRAAHGADIAMVRRFLPPSSPPCPEPSRRCHGDLVPCVFVVLRDTCR